MGARESDICYGCGGGIFCGDKTVGALKLPVRSTARMETASGAALKNVCAV